MGPATEAKVTRLMTDGSVVYPFTGAWVVLIAWTQVPDDGNSHGLPPFRGPRDRRQTSLTCLWCDPDVHCMACCRFRGHDVESGVHHLGFGKEIVVSGQSKASLILIFSKIQCFHLLEKLRVKLVKSADLTYLRLESFKIKVFNLYRKIKPCFLWRVFDEFFLY